MNNDMFQNLLQLSKMYKQICLYTGDYWSILQTNQRNLIDQQTEVSALKAGHYGSLNGAQLWLFPLSLSLTTGFVKVSNQEFPTNWSSPIPLLETTRFLNLNAFW